MKTNRNGNVNLKFSSCTPIGFLKCKGKRFIENKSNLISDISKFPPVIWMAPRQTHGLSKAISMRQTVVCFAKISIFSTISVRLLCSNVFAHIFPSRSVPFILHLFFLVVHFALSLVNLLHIE